jgi:hypothetical protein
MLAVSLFSPNGFTSQVLPMFAYFNCLVWLQEIHALKTQLEASKYEVIKYCIGMFWS